MIANSQRRIEGPFALQGVMEHRWSPRTGCSVPIRIRYRDTLNVHCTITEFSRAGLRLDTGPIDLRPGALVELAADSYPPGGEPDSLAALVIHSSRGRAGLWLGDDPEQYDILQAFIERAGVPQVF
jgi:hypothetical protein